MLVFAFKQRAPIQLLKKTISKLGSAGKCGCVCGHVCQCKMHMLMHMCSVFMCACTNKCCCNLFTFCVFFSVIFWLLYWHGLLCCHETLYNIIRLYQEVHENPWSPEKLFWPVQVNKFMNNIFHPLILSLIKSSDVLGQYRVLISHCASGSFAVRMIESQNTFTSSGFQMHPCYFY